MPGRSASRPPLPGPPPEARMVYAGRAARAYAAMQDGWRLRRGGYRRDGALRLPGTAAHLWPFSRALVATLDLSGVEPGLAPEGLDLEAAIGEGLKTLERYYEPEREVAAYSSDLRGARVGGDLYYDDNAWVGLALIERERLRPGAGRLERAEEVFHFAVSGWDRRSDVPSPGGVFWVEQGRGLGATNHDRNTVSNAPNAELGLHLAELGRSPGRELGSVGAEDMYAWVVATLDAGREGDEPGTGLFWDKVRGDGTIDEMLWSYNQGSMIGAAVLLARRGGEGDPHYLTHAEAMARKALRHFAGDALERQPPAFNAIFFRNLLLLHAATGDEALGAEIIATMRAYADWAWSKRRDARDRFRVGPRGEGLLDQSAMVQVLALLAWDPADYRRLA